MEGGRILASAFAMVVKQDYSVEVFNKVPHFDVAKSFVPTIESHIKQLADIIILYNKIELVGISLQHRHFGLMEGEFLGELRKESSKASLILPHPLERISDFVPVTWKVVGGASPLMAPLEFASHNNQLQANLDEVFKDEDFLSAICAYVVHNKLTDVVALSFIHREHITSEHSSTMEYTDEVLRQLIVVPEVYDPTQNAKDGVEIVHTLWAFALQPMMNNCSHTIKYCTHHCKHTVKK